jgi:hypothetical protein
MPQPQQSFQAERDALIAEITANLVEASAGVRALNKSVQSLNQVGAGFHRVAAVWVALDEQIRAAGAGAHKHA